MSSPITTLVSVKNPAVDPEREFHPDQKQETANMAFVLWRLRGCPEGSPEEDWIKAERRVRDKNIQAFSTAATAFTLTIAEDQLKQLTRRHVRNWRAIHMLRKSLNVCHHDAGK